MQSRWYSPSRQKMHLGSQRLSVGEVTRPRTDQRRWKCTVKFRPRRWKRGTRLASDYYAALLSYIQCPDGSRQPGATDKHEGRSPMSPESNGRSWDLLGRIPTAVANAVYSWNWRRRWLASELPLHWRSRTTRVARTASSNVTFGPAKRRLRAQAATHSGIKTFM